MKVKCIFNEGKDLPSDLFLDCPEASKKIVCNNEYPLIKGKDYVVYAMTIRERYVWYYICDESYTYYPRWNPSPLFQVNSSIISRYWIYSFLKHIYYKKAVPLWTFPEWANDFDYYDRLTDGRSDGFDEEVDIFERYKELMDLEFPDSSVTVAAEIGDGEWLICPLCIDAWESKNTLDALVQCPYCKNVMNNPRYC